jgi:polysaccharide biosynthesis transport protein
VNSPSVEPRQPVEMPGPSQTATNSERMRSSSDAADTFDLWFAMDFRSIFRRRWPLVVIPTAVLLAATIAYCILAKPQYESEATVMLQWEQQGSSGLSESILGAASGLSSLLGMSSDSNDIPTQMQVMTSDEILQDVASRVGLHKSAEMLRKQVKVMQDELGGNVVDVTVRAPTAEMSRDMAIDIVDAYQKNIGDEDATVLGHSAELVRRQIGDAHRALTIAEDRLVRYGVSKGTIDPEDEDSKRVDMLYTVEGDYLDAEQKVVAARADRDYFLVEMRRMPEAIVPSVTFGRNPQVDEAKIQLGTLEAERANLASEFKPADPEMLENQHQIDSYKNQIIEDREEQDSSVASSATGPAGARSPSGYVVTALDRALNPVRTDAEGKLVQAEADAEANQADADSIQTSIREIKAQFSAVPDRTRRVADLKDEVDVDRKIYDALILQMNDLDAQRGTEQIYAKILEMPILTKRPSDPNPPLYTAAALILGIVIGLLAMMGVETADGRIRGAHDIYASVGLAVLGTVPRTQAASGSRNQKPDVSIHSPVMRRIASSLGYLGLGRSFVTLLITSAVPGEGVSYMASQLALELSQQGKRVILVDANLRDPSVHAQFGVHNSTGLSETLRDASLLDQSIITVEGRPSLRLMPAGEIDDEAASRLLNTDSFTSIMAALRERADLVVVDAPAILVGLETSVLADKVDASIVVTSIEYATRDEVRRGMLLLSACAAPIAGVILNESSPAGKPSI